MPQFKYKVPTPIQRPVWHLGLIAFPVLLWFSEGVLAGFLAAPLMLIFWFVIGPKENKLILTERFLLCGRDIVYYGDIKELVLGSSQLKIRYGSREVFVLESKAFHTNARKSDKIRHHQQRKFDMVHAWIQERYSKYNPS